MATDALRLHLARLLEWEDAHAGFDAAAAPLALALQGTRPADLPYSPWELLEHLRLTQRDILDFCRNPDYQAPSWPADYWPSSPTPPDAGAWEASVVAFRADRSALRALAEDPRIDLLASIPQGTGQTYLREVLLAADHTAYHTGQLILVRRLLGAWPAV